MRGAALCLLLAIACTRRDRVEPAAHPIVGPDGSPMLHVSCGQNEARCYELAGHSCPNGYELALTPRNNLLVRCRPGAPAASQAVVSSLSSSGAGGADTLAPSPYAIQETVQPWPTEPLAPSPYPPLAPGRTQTVPEASPPSRPRDLGF
jgi:hypothetical protein